MIFQSLADFLLFLMHLICTTQHRTYSTGHLEMPLNAREQELVESHEANAFGIGISGNVATCNDDLLETVVDFEERP